MSLLDPKLLAFLSVARIGTVHGAAYALRITQTGVTQRLRALERQLSTTLFIRSRTGMKLTHEGEALLRYCQAAEGLEGQVLGEISGALKQTPVSITLAGPTSIVSSRIIAECFGIYQKYPNLLLNFRLDDHENRLELLKKGKAQLVIVSPSEVSLELDSKVLKSDRYVLVGTSKWKGRRTSEIVQSERMIDFYENDDTTIKYLTKFGLMKEARKERIFANTNYAIISMFKAGIGYGTLTAEVAAPSVERGELIVLNQKQVLEDPQALAWYPRKEMPIYFKDIIAAIR